MSQEIDQEVELKKFLAQNSLTEEEYNNILSKINLEDLTEYLHYRSTYNVKVEDFVKWKKSFTKIQLKPSFLDLEYYVECQKDRSYQSNIKIMNDLTKLIKSVESEEDHIKTYYENNNTFSMIKATDSLTKFRKVVNSFLESNTIPKEDDAFKLNALTDLLKALKTDLEKTERINSMSIESVTALQTSKDMFDLWFFSPKEVSEDDILNRYKYCISPKSYGLVVSTFKDLVDRSRKIDK